MNLSPKHLIKILEQNLINMLHLGTRTFEELSGEVVQSTSFVFGNFSNYEYKSKYIRLVDEDSSEKKERSLLEVNNKEYVISRRIYKSI